MKSQPLEELEALCEQRRRAAWRYRRFAMRLIVAKRVYLASIIGYAVLDPTVAAVLLPVAISLIPLVIWQHHLVVRWHRNRRSVAYFERALARVQGRWIGSGDSGWRYEDPDHPYSGDLDIFGRGSLFELLGTPQTASGRDTLANWLQTPQDAATVRARQTAVRELRDLLEFREALSEVGATVPRVGMQTVRIAAAAEPVFRVRWVRGVMAAGAWATLVVLCVTYNAGGPWSALFMTGVVAEAVMYLALRQRILVLGSRGHQIGLGMIATRAYARMLASRTPASRTPASPLLNQLVTTICGPPRAIPQWLAAITGLLLQWPVLYFFVIQLLPMYETRIIRRVARMPAWWEAVGRFETLCAFAAQAFEHPDDSFPEIIEGAPCFIAVQMGHPLVPETVSQRNDLHMDQQLQLLMVSGSNMSGKSTLLRTVGVNAVLALSGAPVRAQSLQISPLVIGSAMRFQDSLERGTSYFYSVLRRLCRVLDLLAEPVPLLFLLDEILQGTNSHDRLVGAEAVIRKLLAEHAIGLVTTHDLELTHVAEHLAPHAANVHFADALVEGRMTFDYRMRPGVVKSSNALALMRSMGLDV